MNLGKCCQLGLQTAIKRQIRKYSETCKGTDKIMQQKPNWSNCNMKRNLHRIKKACRATLRANIYEMYWDFRFMRIICRKQNRTGNQLSGHHWYFQWVVHINGVASSKRQNEKFDILWFENCRVQKKSFCKILIS